MSVTAEAARRFLVARHALAPARSLERGPDAVLDVFRRLGSIQFDPLAVAGRSHDLVLHARVADYDPAWCDLLYDRRQIFEAFNKGLSFVPASEFPFSRDVASTGEPAASGWGLLLPMLFALASSAGSSRASIVPAARWRCSAWGGAAARRGLRRRDARCSTCASRARSVSRGHRSSRGSGDCFSHAPEFDREDPVVERQSNAKSGGRSTTTVAAKSAKTGR